MTDLDFDPQDFDLMSAELTELMAKMDQCFEGYSRVVITIACIRSLAEMFGPAAPATRADLLQRLPPYLQSIWKLMDQTVQ